MRHSALVLVAATLTPSIVAQSAANQVGRASALSLRS